ncbi:MAG: signal recognition particle-docking protein FtsY [Sulfobacillus thermosulfidooxidans]|uniref:Signal recognition particle receptor FtsY n=1 Tax=Sulfobacillus thermotolerans TaxID=338644 RepID=A0ABN5H1Y7_9FIRM|nr:signal recognition particle-docking protein FtsY [Sulfobacillus sp. hq2]AUW94534.1 signal recognition particle-docking protein FtsY [Sulfobacillus thermotolerans]MCY0909433.1 signal recognition particle-docking protein FtsY [Sulfobacillus thermotolerans]POB09170.1 signal recognition particle-docking protein FtsY [Sulfobacillus sp. hq2]PSR36656.1 MAG: signal recognition particle-docking protein FtsY [Sulfobacillus thermosulfidooxidans]
MAGIWNRLKEGMSRTRNNLGGRLRALFHGKEWDDNLWEELEEILYEADLGVDTIEYLTAALREAVRTRRPRHADDVMDLLREIMVDLFDVPSDPSLLDPQRPSIWLMVGVNGTGKTTTAGKFAALMKRQGYQVILGAADTFRAAAVEQLQEWGVRSGVEVVRQAPGADSAAVAYDTVQAAIARSKDLAIIDTAGRLHNKTNLMQELQKVVRVIQRERPQAPHQVWLVIDATTGQNGLAQAQVFLEAVKVTGIVLTKLDGTAKGGIALSIKRQLGLPIRFVGVGEKVEDLLPFDADSYVRAILGD